MILGEKQHMLLVAWVQFQLSEGKNKSGQKMIASGAMMNYVKNAMHFANYKY